MPVGVSAYGPGSALQAAAQIPPSFSAAPFTLSSMLQPKVFSLVSILATAMGATFLAPQFYNELRPSGSLSTDQPARGKMGRFRVLSAIGFSLSALLTAVIMGAGYLTFGGASDGYILNNYASIDQLAQAARLAIGVAIITTYPLLHQGLRDTVSGALGASRVPTSIGCVALVTALAMRLTNLGTVASVSGALVSTANAYVLPGIMFERMLAKQIAAGQSSRRARIELLCGRAVVALGVLFIVVGLRAALFA